MSKQHNYSIAVKWTGNKGAGTSNYTAYERNHSILIENKPDLQCSSDPSFRGDKTKYNPEELFVASISTCHMLWFLHLCSESGVIVTDYIDNAKAIMVVTENGGGYFSDVTLYPNVIVTDESMISRANKLHHEANKLCFIANSCNFKINHIPACSIKL